MKKSGGVFIPNSENDSFVAVTVVLTEDGNDVEKIVNQAGDILFEKEGGGGGD